nr:hypothetical protein [Tanacetum cinerariifolium]
LEASVDRLFDEGVSRDGQDVDVQPVAVTARTTVKDVAPLQPRRQKKRKTVVTDVGGPSHPPKKLREDFRALGGASTAGKSMDAVQSLFFGAMLEAEARGEPVPTLPFVTSSVSATRSVKTEALRILHLDLISKPLVLHKGSSSVLAIATVTTVTAAIDTEAAATRALVAPSLFGVGSSSTGSRVCREMLDEFAPPKFFSSVRGMDHEQLFTKFNVRAARQISLNAEVRMRVEYSIREKRKLRAVVDEQAELLKTKDGEIESLKAQLLLKEAEATKAIRLRAEVFKFESTEQSLRGEVWFLRDQNTTLEIEKNELNVKVTDLLAFVKVREHEVADLDAQVTAVKFQNDNLVGQVHELEIYYARLQEKVAAYEGFINQLEKFQDEKLEECLNSTEYLSALGAAISKAVEKGMQEGLSAGITHGTEGRQLADVAAYNPSAEADYLSALQHLQSNIANNVSALRGMSMPLSEPLSPAALEGMEGTFGSTPDVVATLSTTLVSASTIPPISTNDYEVAHAKSRGSARVDDETATDDDINLLLIMLI